MRRTGQYHYSETDLFQSVRLPYVGEHVNMHVFLPREDVTLETLQSELCESFNKQQNTSNWQNWLAQQSAQTVVVMLPCFKINYHCQLNQALCDLGLEMLFTGAADFSGMATTPLMISKIIQKTAIEVNEAGAEAAAATAVMMARGSSRNNPQPAVFNANRPFFYAIHDNKTNNILFMGFVTNPSA